MKLFYRSHGKHCHIRSFPTKCRKCGSEVLYWECSHGSKIFFDYPIYGKLIKHKCPINKNKRKEYPLLVKGPEDLFVKDSFSCPACGKIFKNNNDLKLHFKYSKNHDDLHKCFYKNKLIFNNNHFKISSEYQKGANKDYKPKFGQINIKK